MQTYARKVKYALCSVFLKCLFYLISPPSTVFFFSSTHLLSKCLSCLNCWPLKTSISNTSLKHFVLSLLMVFPVLQSPSFHISARSQSWNLDLFSLLSFSFMSFKHFATKWSEPLKIPHGLHIHYILLQPICNCKFYQAPVISLCQYIPIGQLMLLSILVGPNFSQYSFLYNLCV